jgi:hypothetical protein
VSEAGSNQTGAAFAHRLRPMSGRDPYETHRVATPLELLFDLTFVIAFGVAASEFAHALVTDYLQIPLFGSIVATGAGLHAAANYIEHRSQLGSVATVVAVAVPVGVYVCAVFGTYLLLVRTWTRSMRSTW